jgi:hypothetical protein
MIERSERFIFLFSFSAFLCISLQLIWSSDVITNVKKLANNDINPVYASPERGHKRQRMCILAGPHKTGTSSVQANMYRWSKRTINFTDTETDFPPDPILNWIWPVPLTIAKIESNDTKTFNWSPAKIYYPMMEALIPLKRRSKRTLFKKYTATEISGMYRDTLSAYWNEGNDIVFGTEAMDLIVKFPDGPSMLHTISDNILPNTIEGRDVTAVVMYRTPKINHLLSIWHENCNKQSDPKFYEWITTTSNTFGPIDSLGMVDMMLKETNWNIVLIDLNMVRLDDWDISNFVACKVLGEDCANKTLKGLNGAKPVVKNVRKNDRDPNVPNRTLDEIDAVLKSYDCNYQHLSHTNTSRLEIFYPYGLRETMSTCEEQGVNGYPLSRGEMKDQIEKIALKHGKLW